MKYREGDEPITGYRLVRVIGRGGFGTVWQSEGPGGIPLAVKVIDLTQGQGKKELRAIHRVKSIVHPNLVPIHGLWLTDHEGQILDEAERQIVESSMKTKAVNHDKPTVMDGDTQGAEDGGLEEGPNELIIAMGLCEQSLADRLRECRKEGRPGIPPDELLRYMEDAARGIDYLNSETHDLGSGEVRIHHGDIKPGNLMVVGGGVQVCDFGLARVLQDSRHTTLAYTPAYAAPEIITTSEPAVTTDQYSLAVSYLEMRCGRLPFSDETHFQIAKIHAEGQLDLSALPQAERDVIARAVSVNPDERYQTVTDMVAALKEAVSSGDTELPQQKRAPTQASSDDVTIHQPIASNDATRAEPSPGMTVPQQQTVQGQQVAVVDREAEETGSGEDYIRVPRRKLIYGGAAVALIAIAVGIFSVLFQDDWRDEETTPPLTALSSDTEDLYQGRTVKGQIVSVAIKADQGADLNTIANEVVERFSPLDQWMFEGLNEGQQGDLNKMIELSRFFQKWENQDADIGELRESIDRENAPYLEFIYEVIQEKIAAKETWQLSGDTSSHSIEVILDGPPPLPPPPLP